MNVVVETLPHCLATLRVEVEPDKITQTKSAVAEQFGKFARIPGYRPGKAPRTVIERKFSKEIREEVEKKLVSESTREAIAQEKLRVLEIANIEDIQVENDRMSFTATVVTHPEFTLPDYKGIPISKPSTEVTDEDVSASLESLREQSADFVDTDDRGAEMDDYVIVDYTGVIDGQPVDELFPKAGKPLTAQSDFWIKMTEEAFFPGYCQALVGAKPGETRKFSVEVPSDFPVEGMPGKSIDYEVTVKSIKARLLPALDDAFADSIVKGKTLDELKALARDEIERGKKSEADSSVRVQIMEHLQTQVECELPLRLVRSETQRIISDIVRQEQERGVSEEALKEGEKEIVGSAANGARRRLKGSFILLRIADQEQIKVTREELLGRVVSLAERYGMPFEKMLKELEKREAIGQIQDEIVTGKTLDFLIANANVISAPAELAVS